ncbi:MAG: Maf-like protein [Raineya sp.]
MLAEKFLQTEIILASASPRRRQLLASLDIEFEVKTKNTEESFEEDTPIQEIPCLLAQRKARAFGKELQSNQLIIAADTIVSIGGEVLNKPQNELEAETMLQKLSGQCHEVITGVCLLAKHKELVFHDTTRVYFKTLSLEEIFYYISKYKPYDKAGSYGAQEWLGMVAMQRIEGSYFNVMGLPTHKLYEELKNF